jgi:DNA-binding MarR family transcriptional regulator
MPTVKPTQDTLQHRGDEPHLLREVIRTHQVLMNSFTRIVGMPASRFALMRLLAIATADTGVMELARQLGVNAAAVTRQVQELERLRLVQRHADPTDGRRSFVRLSPQGAELFAELHQRSHDLERALSALISPAEIAATVAVLARLREFVEEIR